MSEVARHTTANACGVFGLAGALARLERRHHAVRRAAGAARRWHDPPVPRENGMHRRSCRRDQPVALETARDLARAPGRMRVTHRQNPRLDRFRAAPRARQRPPRAVVEIAVAIAPALQPLVARVGMDPEPTTQLPPIGASLQREPHELPSLIHFRHLLPRHDRLPHCRCHAKLKCVGYLPEHPSGMCPG